MYNLLWECDLKDEVIKESTIKWAHDLGKTICLENWERLWTQDINFTACYLIRENMKMCHRWYDTPVKLAKIYKNYSNKCWRCNAEVGTLIHMWGCRLIKQFWIRIHEELGGGGN